METSGDCMRTTFEFLYRKLQTKSERWSYETAPYCGHHYSGHRGLFTYSSYHEGDGYKTINLPFGYEWVLDDEVEKPFLSKNKSEYLTLKEWRKL
jgi:hypothetical protein